MKNWLSLIFAGIIGGFIALSFSKMITSDSAATSEVATNHARQVNLNTKPVVGFNFIEASEKAMPSVVHISAAESKTLANKRRQNQGDPYGWFFGNGFPFESPRKEGTGSGVILSEDGYIVTNNHVVGFADKVDVTLYDNRKFQATIVGKDPQSDLAVLKIEAGGLPVLQKGDSDMARIGEWVLAVGNPFDLTSTVTAGIISAKGRDINVNDDKKAIESFIQTDAAVNPGNSGGALVDAQGRLIGINTAIASRTGSYAGYSFAIPVNIMNKIVDDIIEYGSYQRGFLGVNIVDIDSELAGELGLDISQGVVVDGLIDDGAAANAGLLPNDVITEVDGKIIKSAPELQELIGRAKVGDVVNLTVNRFGQIKNISVKLKAG